MPYRLLGKYPLISSRAYSKQRIHCKFQSHSATSTVVVCVGLVDHAEIPHAGVHAEKPFGFSQHLHWTPGGSGCITSSDTRQFMELPGPDYIVFLVKWVRLAGVPRPTQPGDINTLSPQRRVIFFFFFFLPQAEVSFENNSGA